MRNAEREDFESFLKSMKSALGSDLLCVFAYQAEHGGAKEDATAIIAVISDVSMSKAVPLAVQIRHSKDFKDILFPFQLISNNQIKKSLLLGDPRFFAAISQEKFLFDADNYKDELCSLASNHNAKTLDSEKVAQYLSAKALSNLNAARSLFHDALGSLFNSVYYNAQSEFAFLCHEKQMSLSVDYLKHMCDWVFLEEILTKYRNITDEEISFLRKLFESNKKISRNESPEIGNDMFRALLRVSEMMGKIDES